MKKKSFVAMFALLAIFLSVPCSAQTDNWGLAYPTPGSAPRGNASADFLAQYDSYFIGADEEKVIYLTFDAGYENGYTETILDALKQAQVPAAFFLVGTYIRDHAAIINRMVAEGHIVGNHTMRHPDMSRLSDPASFQKELADAEACYEQATGQKMLKFYRPPSGMYNTENLKMAQSLGYKTIFWSLAYADWDVNKQPTREAAFGKLLPRMHPGAILLLHSTSKTNAELLPELIAKYREMGYSFKSLNELAV